MVVTVGEAIVNGLPLPTNEPPQDELNQERIVPEPPEAFNVMSPESSEQKSDLSEVALAGDCAVEDKIISNELLEDPVIAGPLLITLTRYPVPEAVFAGIIQLIVWLFTLLTSVPITTGDANEPVASDNSAKKVLLLKLPVETKSIVVQ